MRRLAAAMRIAGLDRPQLDMPVARPRIKRILDREAADIAAAARQVSDKIGRSPSRQVVDGCRTTRRQALPRSGSSSPTCKRPVNPSWRLTEEPVEKSVE